MNNQIEELIEDIIRYGDAVDRHTQQTLLTRIRIACEDLVGQKRAPDLGPWIVSSDGRTISSENFLNDVELKVSGDFWSDQGRIAYSNEIANRLNKNDQTHSTLAFCTSVIRPNLGWRTFNGGISGRKSF